MEGGREKGQETGKGYFPRSMAMLRVKGDIRASSESDVWFFSLSHTKNSVSSLDDDDRPFPPFPPSFGDARDRDAI